LLITGGGSGTLPLPLLLQHPSLTLPGIGLSLAQQCHKLGAKILIGDLRLTPEALEWSYSLPKATFYFQTCSVDDWAQLHGLITASVTHFGAVPDVYAPVAGVFEPLWSNFWDDSEDEGGRYRTLDVRWKEDVRLRTYQLTCYL
jgi:NAD(P)-dependent dehydrogenase (short-subunit alcohol dehydrogenase family)